MATCPDTKSRTNAIWLVKVPKFLSERWRSQAGSSEVGRLKIVVPQTPIKGQRKHDLRFYPNLNDSHQMSGGSCSNSNNYSLQIPGVGFTNTGANALPIAGHPVQSHTARPASIGGSLMPRELEMTLSDLNNQTMIIMREDKRSEIDLIDGKPLSLSVEGRIVQKVECKAPIHSATYKDLKKNLYNTVTGRPTLTSVDKMEMKFRPVSKHAEHILGDRARRDNKNVRLDKHNVLDLLFQAFEQHQYYKLVDLARITSQPPNYLKEILQEIAVYNTMPPHKYTWELKPEYRHYKEADVDKME